MIVIFAASLIGVLFYLYRCCSPLTDNWRPVANRCCSPLTDNWRPVANCEREGVAAYVAAAKKTGIRITVRGPVPAPAGRLACSGMAGIWIHKDDAGKEFELTDAMFNHKMMMLPPSQRWNYDL